MTKKMTAFIGAATLAGLFVVFAFGFAREVGAGIMTFNKIQLGIGDDGLVINPPVGVCPREPWPYGCDWRAPTERKQIVKNTRTRHHRYALIRLH